MPAQIIQANDTPFAPVTVDPVTLDIIENALRNARIEMDATLVRTAMSPGIREQGDAFPLIADHKGRMIVGQFGSFIGPFLDGYEGTVEEGDMIFLSDPYSVGGAISHCNDWLVLLPVFKDGRLIAYLDVRPSERHRRHGARIDADPCHQHLSGRRAHSAGQDLEAGRLQ
jgi:N-methylhydantoinase B